MACNLYLVEHINLLVRFLSCSIVKMSGIGLRNRDFPYLIYSSSHVLFSLLPRECELVFFATMVKMWYFWCNFLLDVIFAWRHFCRIERSAFCWEFCTFISCHQFLECWMFKTRASIMPWINAGLLLQSCIIIAYYTVFLKSIKKLLTCRSYI